MNDDKYFLIFLTFNKISPRDLFVVVAPSYEIVQSEVSCIITSQHFRHAANFYGKLASREEKLSSFFAFNRRIGCQN